MQTRRIKLVVVVPAYNEAASIRSVVQEVRLNAPQAEIVVIDDGSCDDSARQARSVGARVISLPYNLGIGGAVQTGCLVACEMGCDILVRLDGDGQHDAAQMAALARPVEAGEADVAIGSRYLGQKGYQGSLPREIGSRLFATLVSAITGRRFTDVTSGFQAANGEAVAFLARYPPTDYPEIEGLLLLHRAGFRLLEVPVTMRPRRAGSSSITPYRALYYVLKVLLAILIGTVRQSPRRRR